MSVDLSIIISVDDHSPEVADVLSSFAAQTLPREQFEVLIVDARRISSWRPAFDEFLAAHPELNNVRLIELEQGGRAKSSNYGILNSTGRIIYFLADDFVAGPNAAEEHLRFHDEHPDENLVGVGSAEVSPDQLTEFSRWLEKDGSLIGTCVTRETKRIPENFFHIGNCSLKRSFLMQAGLFDERFPFHAWDDFDMATRLHALGMRAEFVPKAFAIHYHRITLQDRCNAQLESGESALLFEQKHYGPYHWDRCKNWPVWQQELCSKLAWILYKATREDAYRIAHYKWTLSAHFLKGYEAAIRKEKRVAISPSRLLPCARR